MALTAAVGSAATVALTATVAPAPAEEQVGSGTELGPNTKDGIFILC